MPRLKMSVGILVLTLMLSWCGQGNTFNIVHLPCNYITYVTFDTVLLHSDIIDYLLPRHVSA
jgi:hypothetical protein